MSDRDDQDATEGQAKSAPRPEESLGVAALPPHIRERLDELTSALAAALGDVLVGVLVHGSVVRGEYRPDEGYVGVAIVLQKAEFSDLDSISSALQTARYAARIEATILTESEIAGASDAFPLRYDDIKQRHILLVGRDPFASVQVHDRHRRLRIEQELREAQIRLRRAVTDAFGAREAIGGAVARKIKQVRLPLHALLGLKGIACPPDLWSVVAKIGETYGLDIEPLRAARESPEVAHATLVALLTKTIDDVNAMESLLDPGGVPPRSGRPGGAG